MDRWEGTAGVVREEIVAPTACHQVAELVVAAVHQAATEQAPFGDDNPLVGPIHPMVTERITYNDVLVEQVADAIQAVLLHAVGKEGAVFVGEELEQAFPAGCGIVRQQLNAVDAADSQHGILLVLQLGILFLLYQAAAHLQLPAENLCQEVAVAAGRFKETTVDALRLVLHKVEHSVDLPLIGEDFAMLLHTFARLYLLCLRCNHSYAKQLGRKVIGLSFGIRTYKDG